MKTKFSRFFALMMVVVVALCLGGCANEKKAEPTAAPVAATEVPATEVPATEVPATEVPATEVPATEVPATEVPATEVPATEVPAPAAVKTYADYVAAALDTPVEVETYVQAKQSWWDNKATIYTQNEEGAYFIYEMAISEEDYNKLVPGTKMLVKGYKAEWAGEVEIVDAAYEILEGSYIAEAKDLTDKLASEELINYQNQLALFTGMTVEAIEYKNGEPGDDIYVTLSKDGATYSFCVERYLTGPETEVYAAVGALKAGDVVDVEGYVYWYNGVNTHITKVTVATPAAAPAVTNYADYAAAALDTPVEVETYVQAKQSWWDNKGTFYTQNEEGAYFLYEMAISEEDYNKLVPGTKILVKGFKAEWAGEVEIVDATFEILEGSYVAQAKDLTDKLASEELINYQNQLALFTGMTVEAIEYKNGEPGDDIYVTLSKDGATYSFCVERYLTGPETEVYAAVGALKAGDVVDVEGFVYWYNGVNTHITKVTVAAPAAAAAVTTYADYAAAAVDTPVEVETYVQAKQSWWDNKATIYTQNEEGAYFIYEMAISEEDYNKLVPGTKILVKGFKAEWAGEVEIVDATYEILEGEYIAQAKTMTSLLGSDSLINYQNQLAAFNSVTIEKVEYKNGEPGDDIYVTISYEGNSYDFCVERYLTGPETEVYQTVGTLNVGDVVDIEGFLYWYNGVNTHITKVTVVAPAAVAETVAAE